MVFSTETQSTQSSEYFLIKNSLLRASAVSRDSGAITRKQFCSQGTSEFSANQLHPQQAAGIKSGLNEILG
jgi:hypothetical protein